MATRLLPVLLAALVSLPGASSEELMVYPADWYEAYKAPLLAGKVDLDRQCRGPGHVFVQFFGTESQESIVY